MVLAVGCPPEGELPPANEVCQVWKNLEIVRFTSTWFLMWAVNMTILPFAANFNNGDGKNIWNLLMMGVKLEK